MFFEKIKGFLLVLITMNSILECSCEKRASKLVNRIMVRSVRCENLDENFSTIIQCELKPVNRTLKYTSIRFKQLQPPLQRPKAHLRVLKKASGYKPFGIDVVTDICQNLAGKKNPIFEWITHSVAPFTNINHTCPIDSDLILDMMPLNKIVLPSLFPDGDYRVEVELFSSDAPRMLVSVDAQVIEKEVANN